MDKKRYEKPQNRKYVLARIMKYMLRHWQLLLLALVLAVGSNLLALAGPRLSGKAVDLIEAGRGQVDITGVLGYASLMLALYAVSFVLSYVLTIVMMTVSRRITHSMRRDVFDKITELPVSYFDTRQIGDILSRVSYDTNTINASLSHDLVQIRGLFFTSPVVP